MEYKVTDEHINEYISGELTGNDLIEFEKLLATNEDLQQQIKVHRQIDTVLSENYFDINRFNREDYQNEKERLNPIFNKMNQKYFAEGDSEEKKISDIETKVIGIDSQTPQTDTTQSSPIIRRLLPFAALAAAAALLLFVFNPFANQVSPTQLADQYFESYSTGTLMGEEDNLLANSPKALLEKGSKQYQDNQLKEAIQTFKKIALNNSLIYENKANWYIALCYLKLNKPEAAKPVLRQLRQSSDYKDKAKIILKNLE